MIAVNRSDGCKALTLIQVPEPDVNRNRGRPEGFTRGSFRTIRTTFSGAFFGFGLSGSRGGSRGTIDARQTATEADLGGFHTDPGPCTCARNFSHMVLADVIPSARILSKFLRYEYSATHKAKERSKIPVRCFLKAPSRIYLSLRVPQAIESFSKYLHAIDFKDVNVVGPEWPIKC
jgi:hypothetical protein